MCNIYVQVVVGLPVLYMHLLNVRRIWRLYGPASVLLSPGFGWTVPLTVLLLLIARRDSTAKPAAAGVAASAAERAGAGGMNGLDASKLNGGRSTKDKHS